MKADVHIYAVVRVALRGIEGTNSRACVTNALSLIDLRSLFGTSGSPAQGVDHVEYAEEICGYLVDPYDATGSPHPSRSRWYRDLAHAEAERQDHAPTYPSRTSRRTGTTGHAARPS
jgi:hypothetical protein